ncbi:MAG: FtsH protease activity modulator HflK [Pelagimonas sp.]|uniref:FtsH protease activity modulator HflK n=1 Tax=Pelagimonas sp. TaxID=2073170 RepID=UPI003D6AB209
MAGNSGGPWGGGGNNGGSNGGGNNGGSNGRGPQGGGGKRPDDGQITEIDELMKKGQEQLRVLMGGRGDNGGSNRGGNSGGGSGGPGFSKGTAALGVVGLLALWAFGSFYTVKPEEQSVELFLGEYSATGNPGLNFAPWPFVTAEVVNVTSERSETIGSGRSVDGLMLTTDANIVDIDFQVVWTINDPAKYLFNIADAQLTVQAVSEAVMREIIAASNLAPILNRDRGAIADAAKENVQATLDEYEAGISIVRVNLAKADPPADVIDAFRKVQEAEQERDRLERQADAYANKVVAEARGSAAQVMEQSEGYRARVVNEALGEAARFTSVRDEYVKAPEVTRKRLYLETMENVLGDVDKMILDPSLTGEGGVVPYLPLNELTRSGGNN